MSINEYKMEDSFLVFNNHPLVFRRQIGNPLWEVKRKLHEQKNLVFNPGPATDFDLWQVKGFLN